MALHIDRLTILSMTERPLLGGVGQATFVTELIREVRVTGLAVDAQSDYRVLQDSLDELDSLVIGSQPAGHEGLILVERSPRLLPGHPDVVDINLRYEIRGATLDSIPLGDFILEGSASLNQVTTQRDRAGNPLNVSYTYPGNYDLDVSLRGKTIEQVGDVQVTVKPWFNHLFDALRRGGWHAPVLTIDGKLFSQGVVPDEDQLRKALTAGVS